MLGSDVIATVALARKHGAPILGRGAGTSLAGQCCNVAVVLDFSKYMNRILELDPGARETHATPLLVAAGSGEGAAGEEDSVTTCGEQILREAA